MSRRHETAISNVEIEVFSVSQYIPNVRMTVCPEYI
jgi:hypothetical protein